jgi:hypothetical protein
VILTRVALWLEEGRLQPSYGEDDLRQRGLRLGALEYLIKSHVMPDEVSRAIPAWAGGASRPGG